MTETPGDRLKRARIAAGYATPTEAHRRFGWPVSTINANENGQNGLPLKAAQKYVDAYRNCTVSWLLEGTGQGPEGVERPEVTLFEGDLIPVRVVGVVEAGAFREANEFVEVEHVTIYEPRDPKFPRARIFAMDVAGDSMNDLKPIPIPPGSRVVCVDFDDLGGRVPIQNGMVVVVEQTRDGGHLREWSIKQVEWHDDETWFCPRSTNPKHKPIKVKRDYFADDGREIRLMGLVRAVRSEMTW